MAGVFEIINNALSGKKRKKVLSGKDGEGVKREGMTDKELAEKRRKEREQRERKKRLKMLGLD